MMKRKANYKGILITLFIFITAVLIFDREVIRAIFSNHIVYGMDLHHFYSWSVFVKKILLSGKIPLWGPYTFAGYPFVASLQPAIFYPSTLLVLLLPVNQAYNAEIILSMFLMGIFMYMWLRNFPLSHFSILTGMMIFAFSGFVSSRIYSGHISVLRGFMWLPLIFFLAHSAIEAKKTAKFIIYAVICGIIIGFQVTAGIPQFVLYTILNLVIYVFGKIFLSTGRSWKKGVIFLIIAGFSCFLNFAVQIVPTIEGFSLSSIERSYEYSSFFSFPFKCLISFILPNFFGNPLRGGYRFEETQVYFWELYNYFSILGLVFALYAIFLLRNKKTKFKEATCLMSWVTLFSLLVALGKNTPIFRILYHLIPGVSGTRAPVRILGVLSFSIATLASYGLENLKEYFKTRFSLKNALYFGLVIFMAVAVYLDLFIHNSCFIRSVPDIVAKKQQRILHKLQELKEEDAKGLWRVDAEALENAGFIYAIENIRGANTFHLDIFDRLVNKVDISRLRYLLNVKYIVSQEPLTRVFGFLDSATDLELTNGKKDEVFLEKKLDTKKIYYTSCLNFLEGDYEANFYLKAGNIDPQKEVIANISVLGCSEEILARRQLTGSDFKEKGKPAQFKIPFRLKEPDDLKLSIQSVGADSKNILLNKIEVVPVPKQPERIVWEDRESGLQILNNSQFLPRFTFVPFAFIVDNNGDIAEILNKSDFDAARVVLLEKELPPNFGDIIINNPYAKDISAVKKYNAEIKTLKYSTDEVTFLVNAPKNGILLLSQIYYPGWNVEIDGGKGNIYRADYALCGIPITPGRHVIRLYYLPAFWNLCKFVSLSAIMAVFIALGMLVFRKG